MSEETAGIVFFLILAVVLIMALSACQSDPMPKWKGYELHFNDGDRNG